MKVSQVAPASTIAMMKNLFTSVFLLIHIVMAASRVHHVVPSSSIQCPKDGSCVTLFTLVANMNNFIDSNTTLIFMAGRYTLESSFSLSNKTSFMLLTNSSDTVTITCSDRTRLLYSNIGHVQIQSLNFIRCGFVLESVGQFILEDSTFRDGNGLGSAIQLTQTNTKIMRSSFMFNTFGILQPFLSGTANVGGALIVTNSNLGISHSHFIGNNAQLGGALFLQERSNVSVNDSMFANNTATHCNGDQCHGGAMFFRSSCNVTVHNCTFINNTSGFNGGAIALFHSTYSGTQNVFYLNEAVYAGGAVYAHDSSRITTEGNCYRNNEAHEYGGVIYAKDGSDITVKNSSFSNNQAGDDAGVIYVYDNSSVTVVSSSFRNNKADDDAGVLYANYISRIEVSDSFFVNNEAGDDAGVMYAYSKSSIIVKNSSFRSNKAAEDVGVMYAEFHSSISVKNGYFNNNQAGYDGGVAYTHYHSSITVYNSSFNSNLAGHDGGVVYAYDSSHVIVYNSFFKSNVANDDSGVLCAYDSCTIAAENCSFLRNEASEEAGVAYAQQSSSITVTNCDFANNFAGSDGGVFVAYLSSCITVDNSSFVNNTARNDVGVMWAYVSCDITIRNSLFYNNKASNDGGVLYAVYNSDIVVHNSSFNYNEAGYDGGVAYAFDRCKIIFKNNCSFVDNTATEGGVVYALNVFLEDLGSIYSGNTAISNGGVVALTKSDIIMRYSNFLSNTAGNSGGVLFTPFHRYEHSITLERNNFHGNKASSGGVVALLTNDFLSLTENKFTYNSAHQGGVLYLQSGNRLIVMDGIFINNSASSDGGVIYSANNNTVNITNGVWNLNSAGVNGGVIYSSFQNQIIITGMNCTFVGNRAHSGGVMHSNDSKVIVNSRVLHIQNNLATKTGGAIYLSDSDITFMCCNNVIERNRAKHGGAVFARRSSLSSQGERFVLVNNTVMGNGGGLYLDNCQNIFFSGISELTGNQANNGGAIFANRSYILMETYMQTRVNFNSATCNGGGLFLTMSNLEVAGNILYVAGNVAHKNGGGLHADSSFLTVDGQLLCSNNEAINGGGFSLIGNSELHSKSDSNGNVNFVFNRAIQNGGAMYVDDESTPNKCAANAAENATSTTNCFLQSLFIQTLDNFAGVSGSNLFGGLLDRCKVHPQFMEEPESGITNFQKLSNITLDTVSSHPVRLCFCRHGQPDCSYQPESIQAEKEMMFSLELTTYNQVGHTVNATIASSLNSTAGGLGSGEGNQHVSGVCTKLNFTLFSPLDSEELILSILGPCTVSGITTRRVRIEVECVCPIGFEISNSVETSCVCICNQVLQAYDRTECNAMTKSIVRKDNFWITYINHTNSSGYLIYPYCPFDYCHPPEKQVSVNLNLPNGSDSQCAFNRSGILCGSCKAGLSVSLGSSHCLQCPTYWPALVVTIIIAFILCGIGLVVLLLVLNLTVAVGTLNAIIFYANIVSANKGAFFSSSESDFAHVFISWLNFDLGINTCFFNGMDTYIKTWLQLAFPLYIILLVVVIIILGQNVDTFGHLIGKRDPVATLATLIVLSYTKLLQTVITVFSSATLNYPDGSRVYVWLPDATVSFLTSKHSILFVIAVLILSVGLAYTFLLIFWQWILRCPRKQVTLLKLSSFLETYHAPYLPSQRFWTGLLLLVRVSVYLISAFNPSGDPRISLLSTVFIMSCLFLYISMFNIRLYKNTLIQAMETFTYFNIIALSVFSWYTLNNNRNHRVVTNIFVGITFVQLLIVISYHIYKYANHKIFLRIQETALCQKLNRTLKIVDRDRLHHQPTPSDNDIRQLHELFEIVDRTIDSNSPHAHPKSNEPTQSTVEILKCDKVPPPLPETVDNNPKSESQRRENHTVASEQVLKKTISQVNSDFDNDACRLQESEET